jgi:predicted nucleic acid-binding protein
MKYLVDTDWIIDGIANISDAVTTLRQLATDGTAVSIMTFGELYDGAYGHLQPQAENSRMREFSPRIQSSI